MTRLKQSFQIFSLYFSTISSITYFYQDIYRKILCLYDVYNIVGLIMTFFNDSFRFMALYLIFFFYFYSISFNIATTCTFTFNINLLVFIKIMTNQLMYSKNVFYLDYINSKRHVEYLSSKLFVHSWHLNNMSLGKHY